jgi:hypothetical protein
MLINRSDSAECVLQRGMASLLSLSLTVLVRVARCKKAR